MTAMPAADDVAIVPVAIARAWNVQGRPNAALRDTVQRTLQAELPTTPNTFSRTRTGCALWLGPASWLLVAGASVRGPDIASARRAIEGAGGALFDVSAARVGWRLSGPGARTVLAQGCPLDLHPRAFAAGACAQSVYGHVGALIVRDDDGGTDAAAFVLLVARSYGRDVEHLLRESAAPLNPEMRPALAWP
jgi:sarcosine oxidase subunit gamma